MKKLLAVALLMLLGAMPALADISYAFNQYIIGAIGGVSVTTGVITTNGDIGALQPADIVSWQLDILMDPRIPSFAPDFTDTFGSASGGIVAFTPNALIATESQLIFNTVNFTGFLSFSEGSHSLFSLSSNAASVTARTVAFDPFFAGGSSLGIQFLDTRFDNRAIFSAPIASVPAPLLGAGLPWLLVVLIGLVARRSWRPFQVRPSRPQ